MKAMGPSDEISPTRLRHILSASPAVIYTCAASGDFPATFVSENVTAQLGYQPRDFIDDQRFWADRIHPHDAPHLFAELKNLLSTGHLVVEYRFLHKDGTYRCMRDELRLLRDADGRPLELIGFWMDITEQRRAEAAMRSTEDKFRIFLNRSSMGYVEIDRQFRILFANDRVAELLGCPPENLVGRELPKLLSEADLPTILAHLEQTLTRPYMASCECRPKAEEAAGRVLEFNSLPMPEDGRVARLLCTFADVTGRRQSEAALRESEQRFRILFDSAVDGILLADIQTRAFSMCNRALCQMLGYSEDEIKHLSVDDIHPEEDLPNVMENFRAQAAGTRSLARELPVLRKDGSVFFADVNSFRITLGDREQIAGIFRDVTERKQAADRLRDSEQRYRLIAQNVTDLIWTSRFEGVEDLGELLRSYDPAQLAEQLIRDWRFAYVSPSVEQFLGYQPDEVMPLSLGTLLLADSHTDARTILAEELATEIREPGTPRLRTFTLKHRAKDGSTRWGEVKASFLRDQQKRPVGLLGVTRDITERIRAEQALRKSEAKFRSLFENLPDTVLIVDRNGVIQFINHDMPLMPIPQLIGRDTHDFIAPEYRPNARQALERAFDARRIQTVEVQDIRGCWWSSALVPMIEEDETPCMMIISTDITERRKATHTLKKEQQLLRHLLDLHERDRQLTAYEIHDGFSQYLTAALYNLQGFREMQAKNPSQAQKSFDAGLSLVQRGINEARRMIGGLRPLILDESGVVAAIDYLVCEAAESQQAEVEFVHDVKFQRLAPPLESAVFRIVQESLTNALRHSGSQRIRIELLQHDGLVRIAVRDWGIGFNPDNVEEGRFGLRGIRERARLFGGRVAIETAPDSGTLVSVELPLVESAPEAPHS